MMEENLKRLQAEKKAKLRQDIAKIIAKKEQELERLKRENQQALKVLKTLFEDDLTDCDDE
ncbi:MAG: hypothetical protein ACOCP8_08960 [archaeon]